MKIVDLREIIADKKAVSPKYLGVEQPMYVFHSSEEFYENVEYPVVISNIFEFSEYLKANRYDQTTDWIDVKDQRIWLATGEKAIPETIDLFGGVIYRLVDNKPVRTDNCYIRLYSLQSAKYNYILWTSAGMFNVSLTRWDLSAGVKTQFEKTRQRPKEEITKKTYEEWLEQFLVKKRTSVRDMQVLMLLVNPLSTNTFLDVDACLRKVYPEIRKKDRKRYLATERFRNLFVKQLGKIMPDLIKGVQDKNTPEMIGEFLRKMRDNALEKGDTDDQIKALNVTLKLGYADQILHTGNDMAALEDNKFTPLITKSGEGLKALPDAQNPTLVDDKPQEEDEVKAPPTGASDLEEFTDEDYQEAIEETGAIEGFIIQDADEKKED